MTTQHAPATVRPKPEEEAAWIREKMAALDAIAAKPGGIAAATAAELLRAGIRRMSDMLRAEPDAGVAQ